MDARPRRDAIDAALAALGPRDRRRRRSTGSSAARSPAARTASSCSPAALSDALEASPTFGATLGLDRDDLAHVRIDDLLRAAATRSPTRAAFLARAGRGGRRGAPRRPRACALPGQIATAADLVCFEQATAEPNFVTAHVGRGAGRRRAPSGPTSTSTGRIVLIPSADPGYDWLLARDIAGLITMFGGANSHMAVRAAECSLPAAIGVGELALRAARRARRCSASTAEPHDHASVAE